MLTAGHIATYVYTVHDKILNCVLMDVTMHISPVFPDIHNEEKCGRTAFQPYIVDVHIRLYI